jgi:hypothetical protein
MARIQIKPHTSWNRVMTKKQKKKKSVNVTKVLQFISKILYYSDQIQLSKTKLNFM